METKEPLIYAFKTASGNNYVFDVATNHTYFVDEVDITVIENFRKMSLDELKSLLSPKFGMDEIIKSHQKIDSLIMNENAFFPNFSSDNSHKIPSEKEYFLNTANIQQMTLELTQRCNLRCKYCVFGESYHTYRAHNNVSMTWEIAKRSIDLFLQLLKSEFRTTSLDRGALSFYGGEPLLEFRLMKKCVEYIRQNDSMSEISLNFTTNGTLLNEEIIRFLIKNDFSTLISLDGPAHDHDINRVFENGKPTFAIIRKNLELINSIDPHFAKRKVGFNAVLNPYMNLENVCSFFRENAFRSLKFSTVNPKNTTYYDFIPTKLIDNYNLQLQKLYADYFKYEILNDKGLTNDKPLDELFGRPFKRHSDRLSTIHSMWGPTLCIPGNHKLFVSTDGCFHACERINHHFPVGDCWDGLNYKGIRRLCQKFLKRVKKTKCKTCLPVYNCPICFANAGEENDFNASATCATQNESIKRTLIDYYSTIENHPRAFETIFR